ncbi:MAG TPA: hypothetical protein VI386_29380 [Candidatus Sulfotelmatobacter sp.]
MNATDRLKLLSQILFSGESSQVSQLASKDVVAPVPLPLAPDDQQSLATVSDQDLAEIRKLADSHHVVLRTFPSLQAWMAILGNHSAAAWLDKGIGTERTRIDRALSILEPICDALGEIGTTIVIKSLDHWPDLGSDLDLFCDADAADVVAIMKNRFRAELEKRSWGDRLANKWNFIVPGLPELVEIHVQRLGQTGEQTAIARSLIARSRTVTLGERIFPVPAAEDRFAISTLQRMYRHFYIRLCDYVDNARLVEDGAIDYAYLRKLGETAGIWNGLATYLTVISDYVESYRGKGLSLPPEVTSATRLRGNQVHFRANFLRIPILPHSAKLYAAELGHLMMSGELRNSLRLSLLPGLATAAALEFKLTGSDKGIW